MHTAGHIPEASRHRLYALCIAALFLVCNAVVLSRHEMWLDEVQAWLIARDSTSVLDLFRNLKYEGHPGLWHLLLMPLTRLFASPAAMQGLHLLIATAAVYIFARYSPFSRMVKLLFPFGYFPFYEYAVLSRNYSLGVLLLFIFCALFEKRAAHFLWISLVLFLMCHANVLTLLLAMVIFGVLLLENLPPRARAGQVQAVSRRRLALGSALILLGIATAVLQIIPPPDSGIAAGWHFTPQPNLLRRILTAAFVPIPPLRPNFWGAAIWGGNLLSPVFGLLTLAALVLLARQLLRKPVVLAIFLGCTAALLAFFNVKFEGAQRHHGHLLMLFMTANWIAARCPERNILPRLPALGPAAARAYSWLLLCLLALNVAGAGVACWYDLRLPFSCSRLAAEYIRDRGLERLVLVSAPDILAVPVLGFLGKDRAWHPQRKAFGSYIVWDQARRTALHAPQVLEQAADLSARTQQDVVLLLNVPLRPEHFQHADIQFLASFTGAIMPTENCSLYLVKRPVQAAP